VLNSIAGKIAIPVAAITAPFVCVAVVLLLSDDKLIPLQDKVVAVSTAIRKIANKPFWFTFVITVESAKAEV
tara:strand:- start:2152 stop:2367 length:216 start_codon:yes stop_codon:yes gene_type:complete